MMPDELRALFSTYESIALIANNEKNDMAAIEGRLPENTLFVFFNQCDKVLAAPFQRDAILRVRLISLGEVLDSRKHQVRAHRLLPKLKTVIGVLANRGSARREEGPDAPLKSPAVPLTLDFDYLFPSFYPSRRYASTGFAVALSLLENIGNAAIYLCGFSGVPGQKFSMNASHDWVFEQTLLQLMIGQGRLHRIDPQATDTAGPSLSRIPQRYPEFKPADVALAATQAVNERFIGMEHRVSKLWQMTGWIRGIKTVFRPARRAFRRLID
ncbi:hypothetical protein AX761_18185 [Rhizobium sp. 58]|nr:hypothetical protein AX761_18185 [Rhizobium sp. 58]